MAKQFKPAIQIQFKMFRRFIMRGPETIQEKNEMLNEYAAMLRIAAEVRRDSQIEIEKIHTAENYMTNGLKALLENDTSTYGQSIEQQEAKYNTSYSMGAQDSMEDLSAHNSPEFAMVKRVQELAEQRDTEKTKQLLED